LRCSNRRKFTVPVTMIWLASIVVTLVMGTKIRRRGGTSTTSPVKRAGRLPVRITTIASRTLPIWSPLGSNTPRPLSRAKKTRGLELTREGYRLFGQRKKYLRGLRAPSLRVNQALLQSKAPLASSSVNPSPPTPRPVLVGQVGHIVVIYLVRIRDHQFLP